MYTKKDLKLKLEENGRFLGIETVERYLKNWRIDPVYEDENQIEYYDELAVAKLNQGVILKEQGNNDEKIKAIINNEIRKVTPPSVKRTNIQAGDSFDEARLQNVTVDLTGNTLVVLAESIAQRISDDISEKVKNGTILQPVMDMGKLRRDNEILANQVKKLVEENKKLSSRVNLLLQEKSKYKKTFGIFYIKQD